MTSANITAQRRPLPSGPGLRWNILSVAIFALIWEFAARSEFNFAFPTFTATMAALRSISPTDPRGPPICARWSPW